jgi:hypothetical protein
MSNPQLLHSLGRLVRGLSALFWGLPATLVICAETARVEALKPLELIPAVGSNVLLLFGLWQISYFQSQERPWRAVLDRARLLGLINVGLCPFLFWYNRMPDQLFFRISVCLLVVSGLFFLADLNLVLKQLGAMLPDQALRQETRQFSRINRWLLLAWLVAITASMILPDLLNFSARFDVKVLFWLQRMETAVLLFLGLAPLAITMALIWKAKEVILDGVFGTRP